MSVYANVMKRRGERITREDLEAAVAAAPQFELAGEGEGVWVQPSGSGLPRLLLELTEDGTLFFKFPMGVADMDALLSAARRVAGCIPDAVVEVEGELYEPLPWDFADGRAAKVATKPRRAGRAKSAAAGAASAREASLRLRRERYDRLLEAIREHDVDAVRSMLDAGVHPDKDSGESPADNATAHAAGCGDTQILQLLLDRGASPHGPRREHVWVPIVCAAGAGSIPCMELLLARGADVNANIHSGEHGPPLLEAVNRGRLDAVQFLLRRGASAGGMYGWAVESIEREREIRRQYKDYVGPALEELDAIAAALDEAVGVTPRRLPDTHGAR